MIDIRRGVRRGEEGCRGLPTATRRQHAVVHRGQLPLDLKRSVATDDLMRCDVSKVDHPIVVRVCGFVDSIIWIRARKRRLSGERASSQVVPIRAQTAHRITLTVGS